MICHPPSRAGLADREEGAGGADPTASTRYWRHRSGTLALDRPVIMGILNVTPDSFSDGGSFVAGGVALARAERLVADGADLVDIGGESTRPGALTVPPEIELARVLPVLRLIRSRLSIPISIDTRKAAVARVCLEEGADIVNDVSALADPAMASVVAAAKAGVVLMHMRGTPETMQNDPRYSDVVSEVTAELGGAVRNAVASGIDRECIVVDPGIGFGKTMEHNLELLAGLSELEGIDVPVMVGVSRKGFLGVLTGGRPPAERAVASAAACAMALARGARIFRVHDVRESRDALNVAEAILNAAPLAGHRC